MEKQKVVTGEIKYRKFDEKNHGYFDEAFIFFQKRYRQFFDQQEIDISPRKSHRNS